MIHSRQGPPPLSAGNLSSMLAAAREGTNQDVGELLEATRKYLLLIANRSLDAQLQQKVAPSDVVQETFIDAHRNFRKFSGSSEAELFAWLRQILLHKAADAGRRFRGTAKRDIREEQTLDADSSQANLQVACHDPSPSGYAIGNERERKLLDALRQLPPDYHQVIELRSLERLPFAQVANRMGRSEDAVSKLWFRAIKQLREKLTHLDQSGFSVLT